MVDFSNVSQDLASRIQKIMQIDGEEGPNAEKINSREEYNQLAQLLSGDNKVTGKEKIFVEGLMADYEEEYMVSKGVKDRVLDIIKFGDSKKADDKAELNQLKDYKKTDGLTKEEKNWIKRIINGRNVKIDTTEANEVVEAQKGNNNNSSEKISPKEAPKAEPKTNQETEPASQSKTKSSQKVEVNNEYAPTYTLNNNKQVRIGENQINIKNHTGTINIYTDSDKATNKNTLPKESSKAGLDQALLDSLANQIFDAIDGVGTKELQLNTALKSITKENILELLTTYNAKHSDMFEAILGDLSGIDYTMAADLLKNALVDRAQGTDVTDQISEQKGIINHELKSGVRSDETIVKALNEMARLIRQEE